jgi:hypothetical protein
MSKPKCTWSKVTFNSVTLNDVIDVDMTPEVITEHRPWNHDRAIFLGVFLVLLLAVRFIGAILAAYPPAY